MIFCHHFFGDLFAIYGGDIEPRKACFKRRFFFFLGGGKFHTPTARHSRCTIKGEGSVKPDSEVDGMGFSNTCFFWGWDVGGNRGETCLNNFCKF